MFSTIKGNAAAYYMQIECTELLCRAQDVIPYSPGPYRGGVLPTKFSRKSYARPVKCFPIPRKRRGEERGRADVSFVFLSCVYVSGLISGLVL